MIFDECNVMLKGKNIVIYGCGGHARSVISLIKKWKYEGNIIIVDKNAKYGEKILGYNVEKAYNVQEADLYFIAIGDNLKRKKKYLECYNLGQGVPMKLVAKSACISDDIVIGSGTLIGENAYIGPEVIVGENTIVNTGSILEHEVVIGNHVHIAPNVTICGRSRIGNEVLCGAGSTIIDNIKVCDNVIIGAGSVVVDDIVESGTYVGCPAKMLRV